MGTDPLRRHKITVALPRAAGTDALVPPGAQAVAEQAAAVVGGRGLLTAWTARQAVLSMVLEVRCHADALSAGRAVALAMGCTRGASVEAELISVR